MTPVAEFSTVADNIYPRTYKKSATDDDIEDLKDKIYNNVVTEEDIDKVTERLGDKVCRIYGWKVKKAG